MLRKCLKPSAIDAVLESLPPTLEETYSRILCQIEEQHREDTLKILKWLCVSQRPLRLSEIHAIAALPDTMLDSDDLPAITCQSFSSYAKHVLV